MRDGHARRVICFEGDDAVGGCIHFSNVGEGIIDGYVGGFEGELG